MSGAFIQFRISMHPYLRGFITTFIKPTLEKLVKYLYKMNFNIVSCFDFTEKSMIVFVYEKLNNRNVKKRQYRNIGTDHLLCRTSST